MLYEWQKINKMVVKQTDRLPPFSVGKRVKDDLVLLPE